MRQPRDQLINAGNAEGTIEGTEDSNTRRMSEISNMHSARNWQIVGLGSLPGTREESSE